MNLPSPPFPLSINYFSLSFSLVVPLPTFCGLAGHVAGRLVSRLSFGLFVLFAFGISAKRHSA